MPTFDWIVVGNGLTGAALSYELARQQYSVLLLEKSLTPASATRYSYGGVPYWSGRTDLLQRLCHLSLSRHRSLFDETGITTEFRELDLLLTIPPDQDPQVLSQCYADTEIPPSLISAQEAVEREPHLNPAAIAGALTVRHGHVNPMAMVKAYNHGLQRAGGQVVIAPITGLVRMGDRITGVTTPTQAYAAGNVAIAAGSCTRELLLTAGIQVPVYSTYAEIIETPPLEIQLQTLVMPADLTRTQLETDAEQVATASSGKAPGQGASAPILDVGFIQFLDRRVRIGQISRIATSSELTVNTQASERRLRQGVAPLVPALGTAPGQWRACYVAFSQDQLPVVGPIPGLKGVAVFSGFSSPFALVPGAAVEFARWTQGHASDMLYAFSPDRF